MFRLIALLAILSFGLIIHVSCSGGQVQPTAPPEEEPTDLTYSIPSDETEGIPDDVGEVTPPWLTFTPKEVYIKGNYAYVNGGHHGMHIFDLTDPLKPAWVNWVDVPDRIHSLIIDDGYVYATAYIVGNGYVLHTIDVDTPETANIIRTIELPVGTNFITVEGDFLYRTRDYKSGSVQLGGYLDIMDLTQPDSPYVINTVFTPGWAGKVVVNNGYAYVSGYFEGLHIIDIDPPGSAYLVKTVSTMGIPRDFVISGDSIWVTGRTNKCLYIIGIDPPESAGIVKIISTGDILPNYLIVENGFAYITSRPTTSYSTGLMIFDIDPSWATNLINYIETHGWFAEIDVEFGCAYLANGYYGLQVVDIDPPESAYIAHVVPSCARSVNVAVTQDYAYVSDQYQNLQIVNINPPESAQIIKNVDMPYPASLVVYGQYAYAANSNEGFMIINIDQPESPYIEKIVRMPSVGSDIAVCNGYAYVSDKETIFHEDRLYIIDVDPVESAHVVNDMGGVRGDMWRVAVDGGYAYVTANYSPDPITYPGESSFHLHIIDVDPPDSAYLAKTVNFSYCVYGVSVDKGYAYVANGRDGLQIVDVDPAESAHTVKTIDTEKRHCYAVTTKAPYAFVQCGDLLILDISIPESAYSIDSYGFHIDSKVIISGYYGYVADRENGLRIFDFSTLCGRLADE